MPRAHLLRPAFATASAAVLALLTAAACGTSAADPVCHPGYEQACSCPDGSPGVAVCRADGAGFHACGGCPLGEGGGGAGGPNASTGEVEWAASYGDLTEQSATAAAFGADGQLWVAGELQGKAISLGGVALEGQGDDDVFLARYSAGGAHELSFNAGDFEDAHAVSLAVDVGGEVTLGGSFSGLLNFGAGLIQSHGHVDGHVNRFSPEGATLWSRAWGGLYFDYVEGVAHDGTGAVYVTGHFMNASGFDAETITATDGLDGFVAKIDPSGNLAWLRQIAGVEDQKGYAVAADASGVWVAGRFESHILDGTGAAAQFYLGSEDDFDLFIAKYDTEGTMLWAKVLGGPGRQHITGLCLGGDGRLVIAGHYQEVLDVGDGFVQSGGGEDIFVAKLDGEGEHLWSHTFTAAEEQLVHGVDCNLGGEVALAGSFEGELDVTSLGADAPLTSAGGRDAYLMRFDATGGLVYAKAFGDGEADDGFGVALANDGGVALVGSFEGQIGFDGQLLTSAGLTDIFVAKFAP